MCLDEEGLVSLGDMLKLASFATHVLGVHHNTLGMAEPLPPWHYGG
jgi:hypothetical protein